MQLSCLSAFHDSSVTIRTAMAETPNIIQEKTIWKIISILESIKKRDEGVHPSRGSKKIAIARLVQNVKQNGQSSASKIKAGKALFNFFCSHTESLRIRRQSIPIPATIMAKSKISLNIY